MATIVHPDSYQEEYQVFPYKDLVRIRNQLIKDIQNFEASSTPWEGYTEISEAESPYTEYIVNLMHLSEISLMILKAYPRELEEQIEAEKKSLEELKNKKRRISSKAPHNSEKSLPEEQPKTQIEGDQT